jgi:hypothetical protein
VAILLLHNMIKRGEIVIGNKEETYVLLKVRGRGAEGWSRVEIKVRCDVWAGSIRGSFLKGELAAFAQEVRRLHRDLLGTARLRPIEPNIALTLTEDGKGHITVDGVAQNELCKRDSAYVPAHERPDIPKRDRRFPE